MNNGDMKIEIVCKGCGCRIFDVETHDDSDNTVLLGVSIACHRCRRVLTFKKYTEKDLRKRTKQKKVNGEFRWQMYV